MSFDTTVRLAFAKYHDTAALAQSALAQEVAVQGCLLSGDDDRQAGAAVRILLDWGMAQLQAQESENAAVSYDVLQKRYIEKMSAAAYADLYLISDATAQARRKAAIKRIGKIVAAELAQPDAQDKRQQKLLTARYGRCTDDQKQLLHFLALLQQPVSLQIIEHHTWAAQFLPLVTQLVTKNLIILTNDAQLIEIQPPMRPLAQTQVDANISRQWHEQIATFYEDRHVYEEAIYHWQRSGKHEQSAALLLTHYTTMPFDTIRDFVASYQEDDVTVDTWAKLHLIAGNAAQAADDIDTAIKDFRITLLAQNSEIKAKAYLALGKAYSQRNVEKALLYCESCERLVANLAEPSARAIYADVLIIQAWLWIEQKNDYAHASIFLNKAEPIINQFADDNWYITHYMWYTAKGGEYVRQKLFTKAIDHHWQAWQLAQANNDVERATSSTHNLGTIYSDTNDFDKARHFYEESFHLAEINNNNWAKAVNQKGLGYCDFGEQNYVEAATHYRLAYDNFKESGNTFWLAASCYDLAEAMVLAGNQAEAIVYMEEGIGLAETAGIEALLTYFANLQTQFPELSAALSAHQRSIISYVRQHGSINRPQTIELTALKARRSAGLLKSLVEMGVLVQKGKGRATVYVLTAETQQEDASLQK